MSRGSGKVERRIGELFAATQDRALSVGDLARHAFELGPDATPDRKQRLSATRAGHNLLRRAAAARAKDGRKNALDRVVAETTAKLGRPPDLRMPDELVHFWTGRQIIRVDPAFAKAMETAPSWKLWGRAWSAANREENRFDGVLVPDVWLRRYGWRTTETRDGRLWFHPADYPVRVWAVDIQPVGVVWVDAEIVGIDNTYVRIRYNGVSARLDRKRLARSWTLYRNVYFTSSRSGYAARSFDEMWREQYWRPGTAPPPAMQMPLADAIKLLGVPANFTREEIIAAFRRKAMQCHPDHGGTEAQFIELVKARDRLLAALGTTAAAPKMPEFAPKGVKLRYGAWRPRSGSDRIRHTRRLAR